VITNLAADLPGVAPNTDPALRNAWGVAFSPAASPFWIADNASGCATLYDGTGVKVTAIQVAIPLPDNSVPKTTCQPASTLTNPPPPSPAAPTGLVWNPTTSFLVPGTSIPPASFLTRGWDTVRLGGNDSGHHSRSHRRRQFRKRRRLQGSRDGVNSHGVFLFATNFNAGKIDVFAPNGSAGFRPAMTSEIEGDFTD